MLKLGNCSNGYTEKNGFKKPKRGLKVKYAVKMPTAVAVKFI